MQNNPQPKKRYAGRRLLTVGAVAVVNVADRTGPRLLGSVDTPGEAQDLVVRGTHAYVADGAAGLQVIDVGDSTRPAIVGSFGTHGTARGVDVSGSLAVVIDDAPHNDLSVYNVETPQRPALLGRTFVSGQGKDVALGESYAYVSVGSQGLQAVSLANPSAPLLVGSMSTFPVRGVALAGRFALTPFLGMFAGTGTQVIAVNDPTRPNWRGAIDFTRINAQGVGLGIAVDQQYVYTTAISNGANVTDNGASDTGTFLVGRYQPRYDRAGVAPSVSVVTPFEGQQVAAGDSLSVAAEASDDVEVDGVEFFVNGSFVAADYTWPYEAAYKVPGGGDGPPAALTDSSGASVSAASLAPGEGGLTITAFAADLGGNTKTSAPVGIVVGQKRQQTVTLVSPAEGAALIAGQTVNLLAQATDPADVSNVVFTVNGTALPPDRDAPYQTSYAVPTGASSLTVKATATYFDLTAAAATRTVSVVPPDPTTVSGRVVDFAGRPIAGASVNAFGEFFATSGGDGSFGIAGVPSSRGPVSASASATVDGQTLSGASLATAPAPGGLTNVGNVLLQDVRYETDIGNFVTFNSTRPDDVSAAVQLPSPFTFYGTTYTQVFVGSNGYLTFGSGDTSFDETEARFAQGRPRIAVLFDDWFPDQKLNRGVYVNTQLPGRVAFTWRGVEHAVNHGNPEVSEKGNFQVVLFNDGRIQFGYDDVQTLGGLAGISPGGTPTPLRFNYTATPATGGGPGSYSFDQGAALYEQFFGVGPSPFDLRHSFITFSPQPSGYEMKFYHEPQTTVTGRLVDAGGNPVGGATVSARGRFATTGADGAFSVERVSADGPLSLKAVGVAPGGNLQQFASAPTQPAVAGTTDFGTLAMESRGAAFEPDLGTPVPHAPGSFPKTAFQLQFPFHFYGQSFYGQTVDRVLVNPTGHLTLTDDCVQSRRQDRFSLTRDAVNDLIFAFSNTPVISPLLSDLDPGSTGQVFVRSAPDEWVMTFVNVRRPGAPGTNTFQVVLRADGTIRFAYNGVSNTFGHVGLSPGIFWGMSEDNYTVDWSVARAARMPSPFPFFQQYDGELSNPGARRDFDLDHQVMVFFPNDDGSYDVVRQKLAPAPQSRILFESNLEGDWDLFAIDGDGKNLANLTNHGGSDDYDATFSPDRTKLAFDSYRADPTGQTEDVYLMKPDGTGLVRLTDDPADDYDPLWSPDGTKILFESDRAGGGLQLYVMNADGSGVINLSNGDAFIGRWSPDGAQVVYIGTFAGNSSTVWLVNRDGTNPRLILDNHALNYPDDWAVAP